MTNGWKLGLFCLLGGLCFTVPAAGIGHFWWWWLDGVLVSAALLPVVCWGPRSALVQFGCVATVLVIVGLVCTLSEGVLFYPETKATMWRVLIAGVLSYVLTAGVLAVLARALKLSSPSEITIEHRSTIVAIPMLLLSGLAYVLYYFVFGAITFQFYARKFYPHAAEQVAALGNWFWAYQWGRGLLMTLAVLPLIYALRMPRWKTALAVGFMVWIVGGGAALLVPSTLMAAAQRYAHIMEIMAQNVAFGVTAVWLLRRKTKKTAEQTAHAVTT